MDSQAPILYYAFGGGLGHLTRAQAVRHSLGLQGKFVVLSAAHAMRDQTSSITHWLAPAGVEHDIGAFRDWISDAIERFQPQTFFVDAFPAGILGELCDFPWPPGLELVHVARILRWDTYARIMHGAPPPYTRTWLVEEIESVHHRALDAISARITTLTLEDPPVTACADPAIISSHWSDSGKPAWLIVHSGPDEETAELLAYARECAALEKTQPHFIVISPGTPLSDEPDIESIAFEPASLLFPFAAKIVTACGFNSMRQTAPWRDKHLCMPFARRFDDQFLRRRQVLEKR